MEMIETKLHTVRYAVARKMLVMVYVLQLLFELHLLNRVMDSASCTQTCYLNIIQHIFYLYMYLLKRDNLTMVKEHLKY